MVLMSASGNDIVLLVSLFAKNLKERYLMSLVKIIICIIMYQAIHITCGTRIVAQTLTKTNPILFSEFMIGHSEGKSGGFTALASINYQQEKNFFTARFLGNFRMKVKGLHPLLPIPIINPISNLEEYSLLYGKRFIKSNKSYSISVGPSYNVFTEFLKDSIPHPFKKISKYAGATFEANVKWFKSEKTRYRIYGLIPIGKPTGFGDHIGFKITGNISKVSYVGIGLTWGFGFHKNY